jgi:hypothetical protein
MGFEPTTFCMAIALGESDSPKKPVLSRNASGPAVAMTPSGIDSTHGTIHA